MFKEKEDAPVAVSKKNPENAPAANLFRFEGNKIHFISLGCPRNLVDTEVMIGILLKAGYEATQTMQEADHIVINTCGFLEASREESLDVIGEALGNRKEKAKVIVTGCMVQSHDKQITDKFPHVDYLLGSGDVEGILNAVRSSEQGAQITSAKSYLEAGEVPRTISTPKHYAYLKIAEGCRKQCAYCIIPKIKGPLKSKDVEQVIKEFRVLRKQGVREIILIAQDLGDWGKDKGYKKSQGLILLLKEILKEEGDFWLRLLYLYPDEITEEMIELMKSDKRICPYLDMPIQHINNEVLKSMHRATSKEEVIHTIKTLRNEIPEITIRTSLIVGFPGETEQQFKELEQFVKEYRLDNVGIFKYSREPDSRAAEMKNQISPEVKAERYERLMKIQQKAVEKNNSKYLGKKFECIVEGYHPESQLLMLARHRGQCPDIDGQIIINDGRKVNAFGEKYIVEITEIAGYDLIGKVVKSDPWK
jgi:ribosomal protein S12 methylthiotransferase